MDWFRQVRDYYRLLGPLNFSITFGGVMALIAAYVFPGVWLMDKTGWPEAYGSSCHGRGCWPNYLYHSPKLLEGASRFEILLFSWMWAMPVILVATLTWVKSKRWLKRRRERIRPLE